MTHDDKRHGTTTLFAALDVKTGFVIGECKPKHRAKEFIAFLKRIDRTVKKGLDIHLVLDNNSTHKTAEVNAWLARHPRFKLHFTPTSASWMNLVERFFAEITGRRIRRGVFTSVAQLEAAIHDYLDHHNGAPKPFVWTKTASVILEKEARARNKLRAIKTGNQASESEHLLPGGGRRPINTAIPSFARKVHKRAPANAPLPLAGKSTAGGSHIQAMQRTPAQCAGWLDRKHNAMTARAKPPAKPNAHPVIVIVGRPNVGKSTLYNRLSDTRDALVSDLPGLTRDRREGQMMVLDQPTTIVDTAGLEEANKGTIAARMRQQTEVAVTGGDLILFVIDAKAGVTPLDLEFARFVRNSGRKVILVANKCEGRSSDEGFYDAFSMGFGDPVPVSAEHGDGLRDLEGVIGAALGFAAPPRQDRKSRKKRAEANEDEIPLPSDEYVSTPEEQLPLEERTIRLAIVGRPNAGKSTLVNALLGEDRMITGPEPGLTRDSVSSDLVWKGRKIKLFDTAGLRKRAKVHELAEKLSTSDTVRALRFADVVVLVVDVDQPFEHQDLTIAQLATDEGRALVLAVNKWDLVDNKQAKLKQLHDMLGDRLSQVAGVTMLPISALGDKGLDKLMAGVIGAYDTWNKRITTSALNRWLVDAVGRHAPPASSGRRIKVRYMTQASARPPTFIAFCSKPEDVPKSYIRYLVNSLRETFKMPGVPIRFNLRKSDNPFAGK